MSLLTELYNNGADFIDLHGEINEKELQDNVTVSVPLEYMSEESQSLSEPSPPSGLSDEEMANEEITIEEISDLLRYV